METGCSQGRCRDHLDLGAPFLSTRRLTGSIGTIKTSSDTTLPASNEVSPRVPFLWERAAGVPKESMRRRNLYEDIPMPPKPPPGRWQPHKEERNPYSRRECSRTADDGNDADIDRGDGSDDVEDEVDIFSDALDRVSFSELSGVAHRLNNFDGRVSKDIEPSINRAPSFIMNRFLHAANTLANSSTQMTFKYSNRGEPLCSHQRSKKEIMKPRLRSRDTKLPTGYVPPIKSRPQSTPTACGFMLLSPWSMNQRLCGFKSPVRCQTPAPIKTKDRLRDGLKCEVNSGSGGYDDRTNTKPLESPGWGLLFLDTSRLRTMRGIYDRGKAKASMETREPKGNERRTWRLPSLKGPSESWLSHAVKSIHKTN